MLAGLGTAGVGTVVNGAALNAHVNHSVPATPGAEGHGHHRGSHSHDTARALASSGGIPGVTFDDVAPLTPFQEATNERSTIADSELQSALKNLKPKDLTLYQKAGAPTVTIVTHSCTDGPAQKTISKLKSSTYFRADIDMD